MHGVYERLERENVIGPFTIKDGVRVAKPFQEYPKWVTNASGKRVVAKDLAEEAEICGQVTPGEAAKPDPLAKERAELVAATDAAKAKTSELDETIVKMKAQIAELQAERAKPVVTPSAAPAAVKPQVR